MEYKILCDTSNKILKFIKLGKQRTKTFNNRSDEWILV